MAIGQAPQGDDTNIACLVLRHCMSECGGLSIEDLAECVAQSPAIPVRGLSATDVATIIARLCESGVSVLDYLALQIVLQDIPRCLCDKPCRQDFLMAIMLDTLLANPITASTFSAERRQQLEELKTRYRDT